jgi:hypothetical protein
LPASLSSLIASLKLSGSIGFDFEKFIFKPAAKAAGSAADPLAVARGAAAVGTDVPEQVAVQPPAPAPAPALAPSPASMQVATAPSHVATAPSATRPASPAGDLDFAGRISLDGASMNLGVPVEDARGTLELSGAVRSGNLAQLEGNFALPTLKLAGRDATNFRGRLVTGPGAPTRLLTQMQGNLARGDFVGEVGVVFPEQGPSSFEIGLVLRDADVRELVGEGEKDLSGRLSASLSLEGTWADGASRRGRGDVLVTGKKMYQIPVLLGLLEIANLSLPLSNPFTEATARYSVQGDAVTFEQIEMRSDAMTMAGTGSLDFGTKKVRMNFTTDNPNFPKLPFLEQLVQGARKELFQIRVTGTVQKPQVSAGAFNTVSTTIDEVFSPGGK